MTLKIKLANVRDSNVDIINLMDERDAEINDILQEIWQSQDALIEKCLAELTKEESELMELIADITS